MGSRRGLDDDLLSGALWRRPKVLAVLTCLAGVLAGACAGAFAWPLLSLRYSTSDYSVVAVPFITVPVGALVGLVIAAAHVARRGRG